MIISIITVTSRDTCALSSAHLKLRKRSNSSTFVAHSLPHPLLPVTTGARRTFHLLFSAAEFHDSFPRGVEQGAGSGRPCLRRCFCALGFISALPAVPPRCAFNMAHGSSTATRVSIYFRFLFTLLFLFFFISSSICFIRCAVAVI